jgi:flavin-dependent dehydrogenase
VTVWDVTVIGGGVAGSVAAALLAQGGLRVLLLDKGVLPRRKVCGEFLSPEGAAVLRRLGAWPQLEACRPPLLHTLALSASRYEARCRLPVPGWGASRWTLDRLLWEHAQAAGAAAWPRSPVREVEGEHGRGFTLAVEPLGQPVQPLHARAVLCAAGRHWRGGRRSTAGAAQFVGLKTLLPAIELEGRVELHTVRHGYCGLAAVDGGATTLCCWLRAAALRRAGGTPERFLAAAVRQNAQLASRLARLSHRAGPWTAVSFRQGQPAAPVQRGIWHIGDSAATIAPFTGDGMGMAMQAAELAAGLLLAAFRGELAWEEAAAEYERRWRRAFLPRLRWGRRLETLLLQPGLATLACLALRWLPALLPLLYRRTRDVPAALASTRPTPPAERRSGRSGDEERSAAP